MSSVHRDFQYFCLLNLINHFGSISRTELAAVSAYRPGTVGELVKELIANGFVIEDGYTSTGRGRSRSMLRLNHKNICAVGIYVTDKKVSFVLAQSDGTTVDESTVRFREDTSHDHIIDLTARAAEQLLSAHRDLMIVGIGIACPSYNPILHESETLASNYEHFNDWITQDMRAHLQGVLRLPVSTFSAIGLEAAAEHHFGATKNAQIFINVELSNGIGSSIFFDGSVMRGAHNMSGQLGHTVIDLSGTGSVICSCGKAGCIEATCAWPALKADILRAIQGGAYSSLLPLVKRNGNFLAEDVRPCLDEGDQLCRSFVRRAAERIGVAVANEVNLINPEKVVFHGFMLELGHYFTDQIARSIRDNTLSLSQDFEIVFSEVFESRVPIGAAAEVFAACLRFADFKWVYKMDPAILQTASAVPPHKNP